MAAGGAAGGGGVKHTLQVRADACFPVHNEFRHRELTGREDTGHGEDIIMMDIEKRAKLHGLPQGQVDRLRRLFYIADQNRNGAIDKMELRSLLSAQMRTEVSDEEVRTMLDELSTADRDVDGGCTLSGFLEIMVPLLKCEEQDQWAGKDKERIRSARLGAKERIAAAMRAPGLRMLPDTPVRAAADVVKLAVALYYGITVLLVDVGQYDGSAPVDVALTVLLFGDMLLTLNTAVVPAGGGPLIHDVGEIAAHYARSGFFALDLVGALPVDVGARAAGLRAAGVWVGHLRLLVLVRVWIPGGVFVMSERGSMSHAYVMWRFRAVPCLVWFTRVIFGIHFLACIWVAMHSPRYASSGDPPRNSYVEALYFVLYTLTTVGYGDVVVDGGWRQLFACLLLVIGVTAQGILMGTLTATVIQGDLVGDRNDKMVRTASVLRHFRMPEGLQEEILGYQYHVLLNNVGASYTDALSQLPDAMQDQVGLFIRIRFIEQVPMFASSDISTRIALAQSLQNEVASPETYLIVAGEEGDEMFFLSHGFCDVENTDGDVVATITKGGFFGDVALLVDTKRTASIRSLTFCELFVLVKQDFYMIIDEFPAFAASIQEEICSRRQEPRVQGQLEASITMRQQAYGMSRSSMQLPPAAQISFDQKNVLTQLPATVPGVTLRVPTDDAPDQPQDVTTTTSVIRTTAVDVKPGGAAAAITETSLGAGSTPLLANIGTPPDGPSPLGSPDLAAAPAPIGAGREGAAAARRRRQRAGSQRVGGGSPVQRALDPLGRRTSDAGHRHSTESPTHPGQPPHPSALFRRRSSPTVGDFPGGGLIRPPSMRAGGKIDLVSQFKLARAGATEHASYLKLAETVARDMGCAPRLNRVPTMDRDVRMQGPRMGTRTASGRREPGTGDTGPVVTRSGTAETDDDIAPRTVTTGEDDADDGGRTATGRARRSLSGPAPGRRQTGGDGAGAPRRASSPVQRAPEGVRGHAPAPGARAAGVRRRSSAAPAPNGVPVVVLDDDSRCSVGARGESPVATPRGAATLAAVAHQMGQMGQKVDEVVRRVDDLRQQVRDDAARAQEWHRETQTRVDAVMRELHGGELAQGVKRTIELLLHRRHDTEGVPIVPVNSVLPAVTTTTATYPPRLAGFGSDGGTPRAEQCHSGGNNSPSRQFSARIPCKSEGEVLGTPRAGTPRAGTPRALRDKSKKVPSLAIGVSVGQSDGSEHSSESPQSGGGGEDSLHKSHSLQQSHSAFGSVRALPAPTSPMAKSGKSLGREHGTDSPTLSPNAQSRSAHALHAGTRRPSRLEQFSSQGGAQGGGLAAPESPRSMRMSPSMRGDRGSARSKGQGDPFRGIARLASFAAPDQ